MINLINFANCPINQYVPLIIMYSFVHSILFSILITQYYTKIMEHISLYFNFVNIYKIAIFHTIITNIPRIYFLVYTDIYNETSFINGFNALYLSLGMGIIVLFAHFKTFLDFESFLKDLFALAGGLAIQGLNLNSWQFNSLQILGGIFHFSVFLFLTLRLKYVERRTNFQTTPRMPFYF